MSSDKSFSVVRRSCSSHGILKKVSEFRPTLNNNNNNQIKQALHCKKKKENTWRVVKLNIHPSSLDIFLSVRKFPSLSCWGFMAVRRSLVNFRALFFFVSMTRYSQLDDTRDSRSRVSCCKLGWCVNDAIVIFPVNVTQQNLLLK